MRRIGKNGHTATRVDDIDIERQHIVALHHLALHRSETHRIALQARFRSGEVDRTGLTEVIVAVAHRLHMQLPPTGIADSKLGLMPPQKRGSHRELHRKTVANHGNAVAAERHQGGITLRRGVAKGNAIDREREFFGHRSRIGTSVVDAVRGQHQRRHIVATITLYRIAYVGVAGCTEGVDADAATRLQPARQSVERERRVGTHCHRLRHIAQQHHVGQLPLVHLLLGQRSQQQESNQRHRQKTQHRQSPPTAGHRPPTTGNRPPTTHKIKHGGVCCSRQQAKQHKIPGIVDYHHLVQLP